MGEQNIFVAAWALFTKIFLPWVPGALGSFVALKFLGDGLPLSQRITSFGVGLACMYYGAPALIEYGEITNHAFTEAIKFAVGLFSYAVIREMLKELNELNILQTLRDKYLGGKS